MPGIKSPFWELAPAALTPGEAVRVFLEDPNAIPPVLAVGMQAQDIQSAREPRATRKGAWAPLFRPRKYHIVYLRLVLRLTDGQ